MNTTQVILLALVVPLLLAAAVGFPAWIAVRTHGTYTRLRDDYRTAVGLPLGSSPQSPSAVDGLKFWIAGYYAVFFLRMIHSSLGFTGQVLLSAGLGFWFLQKAYRSFVLLRSHPGLEPRLRRVPLIEIATWSTAGLALFTLVHLLIATTATRANSQARTPFPPIENQRQ